MDSQNSTIKNPDRWKQRFANFEKAYQQLVKVIQRDSEDFVMRLAIIKAYELVFELGWKTMKDKLEYGGITVALPHDVIKQAFQQNFIIDGPTWLDMLEKRNELTHTYDDAMSKKAVSTIEIEYLPAIEKLHDYFTSEIGK